MDIPESLLITDMDNILHMVLRGRLSELMAQLTPSGSQSTTHIQVHYFLIKDNIADGDKNLEHS